MLLAGLSVHASVAKSVGGYDFDVPSAPRRPRHRRRRHRLRAHRAGTWPRGLRHLDSECACARSARHQSGDPLHRRRERRLHRASPRLHRQARHQRQGREGRRQRGRDQGARRGRQHHRARAAQASVSALLALQEAGDLPQHAAVVHRDGQADRASAARIRCAIVALDANQSNPLGAARGREPHQRHDREPPRLGDLAPARLGRADRGVRARECRRLGRPSSTTKR